MEDEEDEAFHEEESVVDNQYRLSLVGRSLTDRLVYFPSLQNTLADLWHPLGGIYISELGGGRYLFQFFHEVDVNRVIIGTPWFFNNHLLILHKIMPGENPLSILLNFSEL